MTARTTRFVDNLLERVIMEWVEGGREKGVFFSMKKGATGVVLALATLLVWPLVPSEPGPAQGQITGPLSPLCQKEVRRRTEKAVSNRIKQFSKCLELISRKGPADAQVACDRAVDNITSSQERAEAKIAAKCPGELTATQASNHLDLVGCKADDIVKEAYFDAGANLKTVGLGAVFGSSPEVCDGKDNDCDGQADEELGNTSCGVGECARTVANCAGGLPQVCTPGTPSQEVCDGKDNDCDGSVDEGADCSGLNAECKVGVCTAGACVAQSRPQGTACTGGTCDAAGNCVPK